MLDTGSTLGHPDDRMNRKIQHIILSAVTIGLLAGGLTACITEKEEGNVAKATNLEAQARITKAEAGKIALVRVTAGMIKEGKIEKEKGKLIWSFDIAMPSTKDITEVRVDAITGRVLDGSKETIADQEKERK